MDLVDNLVLYLCGLATSSVDQPDPCNGQAAGAIGPASRHPEMVTTPRVSLLRSNHCVLNITDVYFFTVKMLHHAAPEQYQDDETLYKIAIICPLVLFVFGIKSKKAKKARCLLSVSQAAARA
jgi:hypothetical protein